MQMPVLPQKANIIGVLEILLEYSDADHILATADIIAKMKSIYMTDVDRRTVYGAVDALVSLGWDISCFKDNGKGYYLAGRPIELTEIRLIMDSLYSNQAISASQTVRVIKKLQKLLNVYSRKNYKNLTVVRTGKKTPNPDIFLNIEVLDEAVQSKRKVKFQYLKYDLKKKLVPRRSEQYIVEPHQLINTNEHYYLLCSLSGSDQVSMYRIDKMRGIEISEESIETVLSEDKIRALVEGAVYAWAENSQESIEIRCDNKILDDVIDKFGRSVMLRKDTEGSFIAKIKAGTQGVKFWALQYLSHAEVLSPKSLRDEITEIVKGNPYTK